MNCDRRHLLTGMAGLPLLSAQTLSAIAKDRALILLWLDGGLSHLDTFDGKPKATPEVRGDLKMLPTGHQDLCFAEGLPRLRKLSAELTVFRSITHGEGQHDRASNYLLTGHRPSPVLQHPSLAASYAEPAAGSTLPAFIAIPDAPPRGGRGFLPVVRSPFELGAAPGKAGFAVRDLQADRGSQRRQRMLRQIDQLDGAPRDGREQARDSFLAQAQALSLDPEARAAFDLQREDGARRSAFGRHEIGQSLLLARRLVQGGSKAVLIRNRGWDHHRDMKRALTYGFPPLYQQLDEGISALIEDLRLHKLEDKVLFLLASEFGRTPRLNQAGGRDHWPRAQTALAFGAGMQRGAVIGRTDRNGTEPIEQAVSPADLHATCWKALGADHAHRLQSPDGRPVPRVEAGGTPIAEALA